MRFSTFLVYFLYTGTFLLFADKILLDQKDEPSFCTHVYWLVQALGDLVESCMGAILLDTGFDLNRAWQIILSFLKPVMSFTRLQLNPTRELYELCQSFGWNLKFLPSKKDGNFLVEARVNGENVSAAASALNINKKSAQRMAAQIVCSSLKVCISLFYVFVCILISAASILKQVLTVDCLCFFLLVEALSVYYLRKLNAGVSPVQLVYTFKKNEMLNKL